MRITTRGRYGVAAMCELASRPRDTTVPLRDIASEQGLSEGYLEQLFLVLRRSGLVKSVRGAQGGYALAKDASEITVGDVLRVVEGPIAPVPCVNQTVAGGDDAGSVCRRDRYEGCLTRRVWRRLAACMASVLDGITLADLIAGEDMPLPDTCPGCRLTEEVTSDGFIP